jgi:DNA-binding NarL/FixJ family response regulator
VVSRPTVLIADDHVIVVEGLRALLSSEFTLLPSVSDGRSLVRAAVECNPDVIVLDISMPLLNGLEAARQIRAEMPRSRLIFLTMHSDLAHVREAFRVGASGYVLKRSASTELVTAIREALSGRCYLTPLVTRSVVELLIDRDSNSGSTGDVLTPRQREVLQLLAEGHSVKEAGAILHISSKTVEFHKYRLMETLGVGSIAELTQYAVKTGVISTDAEERAT